MSEHKMKKLLAFTLAEVLITLVIIGIVAALTIPSVVVSYQKHQAVTKLKKTYAVLSQTTNKAIADWGPIKTWEVESETGAGETKKFVDKYIAAYLNVLKNCGYNTTGDCELKPASMNNPSVPETKFGGVNFSNFYKLILADGVALYFGNLVIGTQKAAMMLIDINGKNAPNVYGKDVFVFVYWVDNPDSNLNGKFLPNGINHSRESVITASCNKQKDGKYCSRLIMLDNWQMKDDYPW